MKLLSIIRAVEWWDYKFPPILVGAYLLILKAKPSFIETLSVLGFIIASLAVGAIYVSILNDITDIQDDQKAGKTNRMAHYNWPVRLACILMPAIIALAFAWLLRHNTLSLSLYLCCYLSFTFYSLPPFRLKNKGIWGVLADAAGSQLFPTLYTAAVMANYINYELSVFQLIALSLWSLCFGLRGILWHQFHDLDNDIKSVIKTWAQKFNKQHIKLLEYSTLTIELSALLALTAGFGAYFSYLCLIVYGLYVWFHYKTGSVEIIIINYTKPSYYIIMNEYYQVFLPLTLLAIIAFSNVIFFALLGLHLLFFPMGVYRVLKNIYFINKNSHWPVFK